MTMADTAPQYRRYAASRDAGYRQHGKENDDSDSPSCHDARDLISNGVSTDIVLDGQRYTLRITRAGKLILTK